MNGLTPDELTPEELAAAQAFGMTPEAYAENKSPEAAADEISAIGEELTEAELVAAEAAGMSPEKYAAYKSPSPIDEEFES
jgi:hypothetical protein